MRCKNLIKQNSKAWGKKSIALLKNTPKVIAVYMHVLCLPTLENPETVMVFEKIHSRGQILIYSKGLNDFLTVRMLFNRGIKF